MTPGISISRRTLPGTLPVFFWKQGGVPGVSLVFFMAGSGTQFDPECVAVFMAIKPELVKIRTEEEGGGGN
jgi:hypothetical protein